MSIRRSLSSPATATPPAKKAKTAADSTPGGLAAIVPKDGRRPSKQISAAPTHVAKDARASVNEADVAVVRGVNGHDTDLISISSDSSSGDSDADSDEDDVVREHQQERPALNGRARGTDSASDADSGREEAEDEDVVMINGDHEPVDADEGAAAPGEPSFGEILAANNPEPIDVEPPFADANAAALTAIPKPSKHRQNATITANSFGTVLAQALRTNDKQLLESCFETHDLDQVRNTIDRLPSSLVEPLLRRLAERCHKRPGRWGNLIVWVQWSLATHGGYLARQPTLIQSLEPVDRVLKDRASAMPALLSLKGKLDMLDAQKDLRRRALREAAMEEYYDEPTVVYVEGQTDDKFESEDEAPQTFKQRPSPVTASLGRKRKPSAQQELEELESSEDEMPTTNGIIAQDESDHADDEDEDLIDDEAEETENDSGDDLSSADEFEDFIDEALEDAESGDE